MVFLVLFVAAVVTICMVTVWPWPGPAKDAPPARATAAPPPAEPASLEGVLATELLAGEISTTQ